MMVIFMKGTEFERYYRRLAGADINMNSSGAIKPSGTLPPCPYAEMRTASSYLETTYFYCLETTYFYRQLSLQWVTSNWW